MDYVPQEVGMYDTSYQYLDEPACRSCHGASLQERHHGTDKARLNLCYTCHEADSSSKYGVLIERDCVASGCHGGEDPYANGWHHMTDMADAKVCIGCHGVELISQIDSVDLPMYPTTFVTPTPQSCANCHRKQDKIGEHPRQNPEEVQYRYPIVGISELHHMGYEGYAVDKCYVCHGSNPDPSYPLYIRYCERCHTPDTLHGIPGHVGEGRAWEATDDELAEQSDQEPTVYSKFSAEDKCFGCHSDNVQDGDLSGDSIYYTDLSDFVVTKGCRYCHGASVADRHHSEGIVGGNCIECHNDFVVIEDCRYCHGASVADRHHSEGILGGNCIECHPIQIKKVWVTDSNDVGKGVFSPGEEIRYHIKYNVEGHPNIEHKIVGRVSTEGSFTNLLKEVRNCYPGTYEMTIDGIIPTDAKPGKTEISYKVKGKEVDMPDILGIDKRSGEISVSQIVIKKVWVTDSNDVGKGVFSPGEEIRYHIKYNVEGHPNIEHKIVGRVSTEGSFTNLLKEVRNCYPGTYEMTIDGIIPTDAKPGKTEISYKVKLKEVGMLDGVNIDEIKGEITVEHSLLEPEPSDVHEADGESADQQIEIESDEKEDSQMSAETDEGMVDETEPNSLFGVAGGIYPFTSGDSGAASAEIEEKEPNEPEVSDLAAVTEESLTRNTRQPVLRRKTNTSRGSREAEIHRRERLGERNRRQRTNVVSRSVGRALSFFNDEGIPNVRIRGILHCGEGDPRNIAVVELADGKKHLIREGDTFSNVEVLAIFPRCLRLRYRQHTFENDF